MGGLSIARGIIGGLAGAAGNTQTQQEMATANQQAAAQKQNELKAKIAPLSLGIKNLQAGIQQAYSAYQQQNPDVTWDQWKTGPGAQQFQHFVDQTQHAVHSMREILHPDHQAGPTDWLKTHLTDRMHITNADHRAEDEANNQAWNKYDEGQFTQTAANRAQPPTPWNQSDKYKEEQMKQQGATALENQKTKSAQDLEAAKEKYGLELEKAKADNAQKIEGQRISEQERREDDRMKMFAATQARIERDHDRAQGTWSVVEDGEGNPKLFNSKTGEQKDAPEGMHRSGYYAKQIAPLAAAEENIRGYMDGGAFTGPGDLDLQHQFFTATQPATGFRMTKVQQDILANSQSLINKGKAAWAHLTGGTIFSPEQRKQIAEEAQKAIVAKKQALNAGGEKTKQLMDTRNASAGGGSRIDSAPAGPKPEVLKYNAQTGRLE
jgi:hypothetical protein